MKVTIIGSGFSGSILALYLNKQTPSIPSIIYESRSKSDRSAVSGSVTLTANALRILDDLGIYKKLKLRGHDCERINLYDQKLQVLGSMYQGDEKNHGYTALRIKREYVIEVLEKELGDRGIEVVYGMVCNRIEEIQGIEGVKMEFDGGKVVMADYLVGADGIHSIVRREIERGSEARYLGVVNLGGTLEKSHLTSREIPISTLGPLDLPCVVYGDKGAQISLIPEDSAGNEIGVFATAEYQDLGDKGWEKISREKEKLKIILGGVYCVREWPKEIRDLVRGLDSRKLYSWPHHAIPQLAHYVSASGNITLIGEGAHTMPTTGGQEVAMAIEDAASLAHVLSRCNSGQLRKNLLGIWERHRMQRVDWVGIYSARTANYVQNYRTPKGWMKMFKEWTMWACFWWLGEDGGMRWVYDYKVDSVLPALVRV